MKTTPEQQWNEDAIAEQAADWVLRLDEGDVDENRLKEWERWVQQSPLHADAYEKMTHLLCLSSSLAEEPASAAVEHRPGHNRLVGWLTELLTEKPLWIATPAMCVLVAFAVTFYPMDSVQTQYYSTETGQHRSINLNDGSIITLSAKSSIKVRYSDNERNVQLLSGQALFDVHSDPSWPFIVETGSITTRVVGTRFDIRRSLGDVSVTVLEGIVDVKQGDASEDRSGDGNNRLLQRLSVGEQLHIPKSGDVQHTTGLNPALLAPWQNGQLIFSNEPLVNVISDLNRYSERRIVLAPSLNTDNMNYTGTIQIKNLDEWLNALPLLYGVTVGGNSETVYLKN